MRNRKSLLVISIFALVLVLSVGYAVISYVDVYVTGSAAADAEAALRRYFRPESV